MKLNLDRNREIVVLDTNVLLYNRKIFLWLKGKQVIVPTEVFQELRGLAKSRRRKVKKCACRALEYFYKRGPEKDLIEGIVLSNGCVLSLRSSKKMYFKKDLPDNRILSLAIYLSRQGCQTVVLISRDRHLRRKAMKHNICAISDNDLVLPDPI